MAINWSNIFNKYNGLWVGLKDDEKTVLTSGKSVKEVMKKAKIKGFPSPILFRVPRKLVPYVGGLG